MTSVAAVVSELVLNASHSRGLRMVRSSSVIRGRCSGSATPAGTVATTAMPTTAVAIATAQKAARQPSHSPIRVPSGSPITVATVSPPATTAIALARRSAGTSPMAVTDATAQNPA